MFDGTTSMAHQRHTSDCEHSLEENTRNQQLVAIQSAQLKYYQEEAYQLFRFVVQIPSTMACNCECPSLNALSTVSQKR